MLKFPSRNIWNRIFHGNPLILMFIVAITKATPSMMTHLGWGTFLLYAILTYIGFVFVYFCMPEFKGKGPH